MRTVLLSLLVFFPILIYAQEKALWNGKKCAVALTYDDALPVHLDNVVPALDSVGLKATFYRSGYFPGFVNNITRWRSVAGNSYPVSSVCGRQARSRVGEARS